MARMERQELLEGVRIDWLDTEDASETLRERARAEVLRLSRGCGRMRAMAIECRPAMTQLVCNCIDGKRAIRVRRATLLEALRAFAATARARCWN